MRNYLDFIKCLLFLFISELMLSLGSYYLAIIMIFARKSRRVVYGRWWALEPERFVRFYGLNGKSIVEKEITSGLAKIHLLQKHDHIRILTVSTEEEVKKYENANWLTSIYLKLRYMWYYTIVWCWLDDLTNVNGVDVTVLRPYSKKFINIYNGNIDHRKFLTEEKFVLYTDTYYREYVGYGVELAPFFTRLWFVKFQWFTNLERDTCTKPGLQNIRLFGKRTGFIYCPEHQITALTIMGFSIFHKGE